MTDNDVLLFRLYLERPLSEPIVFSRLWRALKSPLIAIDQFDCHQPYRFEATTDPRPALELLQRVGVLVVSRRDLRAGGAFHSRGGHGGFFAVSRSLWTPRHHDWLHGLMTDLPARLELRDAAADGTASESAQTHRLRRAI